MGVMANKAKPTSPSATAMGATAAVRVSAQKSALKTSKSEPESEYDEDWEDDSDTCSCSDDEETLQAEAEAAAVAKRMREEVQARYERQLNAHFGGRTHDVAAVGTPFGAQTEGTAKVAPSIAEEQALKAKIEAQRRKVRELRMFVNDRNQHQSQDQRAASILQQQQQAQIQVK